MRDESSNDKLPLASEQGSTLFVSSGVIRHATREGGGTPDAWPLCECRCSLRVWEIGCCCPQLRARCSSMNVVLTRAGTSPHFLEYTLGRIMLVMSDALVSDNRHALHPSSFHHLIQRAILRHSLLTRPVRQQPPKHFEISTRQSQNPFPLFRPHDSLATFKHPIPTAAPPLGNIPPFSIPEGRFQQHHNPQKKTEGKRSKGAAKL